MTIVGVGVDIIETRRVRALLHRRKGQFLRRVYSEEERRLGREDAASVSYFAARYAGKEAVLKALGVGLRFGIVWREVEIKRDPLGAPVVSLSGRAKKLAVRKGVRPRVFSGEGV